MREDRKKRNRRDRRGARTAAAGRSTVMTLENGSLLIRVPEELDHHSAAQISCLAASPAAYVRFSILGLPACL